MTCRCGNNNGVERPSLVGQLSIGFAKGDAGLSAYEVALKNGFVGTESEWLASLQGRAGASAYQVAVANGFCGTQEDWLNSLVGPRGCMGRPGQSAYDIAVEYGFDGTPQEWIDSLKEAKDGKDGASAYQIAVMNGYEGTVEQWLASLKGIDGKDGASAYQIAVMNGFQGTELEWLNSLKGSDGVDGKDGADGLSAYQLAVAQGYEGDLNCWLASLKGKDGPSAYDIAVEYGYEGSVDDWLASLDGKDGASAYQVAVMQGYEGSVDDWLASLQGKQGASAYDVAREYGYEGTTEEWLASLKGEKGVDGKDGASAYQIAVMNGFEGTEEEWLASLKAVADITKESIGLGKVDNTSDAEKAVLSASKLTTPVNISLSGAFTAMAEFDGSKDVELKVEGVDATKLQGIVPLANLPYEELTGGAMVQSDWNVTDESDPAFIKNKPTSFDVDLSEIEAKLDKKVEIAGEIIEGALMMADADGNLVCGPKPSELGGSGNSSSTVVAGVTVTVKATEDGGTTIDVPEAAGEMFSLYHNGQLLVEDVHYAYMDGVVTLIGFTTYIGDLFTFVGYSGASGVGVATIERLGLVKSSASGLNKVIVAADGTMYVEQLDMSTLVTTDDTEIILNGGTAN